MTKASDNEYPSVLLAEQGSDPSTPAAGFGRIYKKSDGLYLIDDGGIVSGPLGVLTDANVPTEIDYTAFTGNVSVTATTEATANSIVSASAHTFSGSQVVLIEFFAPYATPDNGAAGRQLLLYLYEGSSSIGLLGQIQTPAAASARAPLRLARRITPGAGSKTYSIRAAVSAGTGTVFAGAGGNAAVMPGFIRIVTVV